MKKIIAAISAGALAVTFVLATPASAQIGVGGGADGSVGTTPLYEPTDRVDTGDDSGSNSTSDQDTGSGSGADDAGVSGSVGASASTGTGSETSSFSLTQEDAAGASLDAESASLGAVGVATSEDLSAFATSIMKRDAKIENVEVSDEAVSLTYRKGARFLGFIPGSIRATASVTNSGDVEIDYPWYRFIFAVEGADEAETQLNEQVSNLLAGRSGAFTATLEAAILEAMHVALASDATASTGITADMAGRASDIEASGTSSMDLSGDGFGEDSSASGSGDASGSAGTSE